MTSLLDQRRDYYMCPHCESCKDHPPCRVFLVPDPLVTQYVYMCNGCMRIWSREDVEPPIDRRAAVKATKEKYDNASGI